MCSWKNETIFMALENGHEFESVQDYRYIKIQPVTTLYGEKRNAVRIKGKSKGHLEFFWENDRVTGIGVI